ncbi:DUF4262 domain-containing protein [Paenibacillus xylanexedens]|uniref:DUF4262 domain-containing protein n=1 Tax=Paenibacillus xylanexedens TaxID=528191 RepID=UPI0011A808E5|nr:DUF4262 domain-containing protein [Paenibacillus xylanexedens]
MRDEVTTAQRMAMQAMHDMHMYESGWYAHAVPASEYDGVHANYHTHGLPESFGHKDFQVVFDVSAKQSHAVINGMIAEIKEGRVYESGKVYDDILRNGFRVKLQEFREGDRPVLRLILCDPNNRLPGEFGCDPAYLIQLDDYPFDGNE